jgi:hypothetical protein
VAALAYSREVRFLCDRQWLWRPEGLAGGTHGRADGFARARRPAPGVAVRDMWAAAGYRWAQPVCVRCARSSSCRTSPGGVRICRNRCSPVPHVRHICCVRTCRMS